MASQKTLALTLRVVDFSETSQVVTVYSRDFGRLSLLAKGSKRKRHGTQTAIDLLQLLEIVFIEKPLAHLELLTESSLREDFPGLRGDLRRGYSAFFVAELLLGLSEEHDPNPGVFDLAVETLRMLCGTKHPDVVLHAFEVRLLSLIGLLPRLEACAWCGGELGTTTAFAPGAGGALCATCASRPDGARGPAGEGSVAERIYVSRGALAVLGKLAVTAANRVERLRISGTIAKDVRKTLARLWMHILGREPQMLKYLTG